MRMRKKLFATITIGVVFLLCVYAGWKAIDNSIRNICVLENPRHVISGRINSSGGILSKGPHDHYLFYRGKRKLTGEICSKFVLVTEKEYERSIYGQ